MMAGRWWWVAEVCYCVENCWCLLRSSSTVIAFKPEEVDREKYGSLQTESKVVSPPTSSSQPSNAHTRARTPILAGFRDTPKTRGGKHGTIYGGAYKDYLGVGMVLRR